MADDIDTILKRIKAALWKRGRKTLVANETGMAHSQLTAASKPDWNPSADTIRKLDRACKKLFPGETPDPEQPQV